MSNIVSKTLLAIAAIGAAITMPAAAQRVSHGEAIVYKDPGFRGPALVISGAEPNLAEVRFNDTISSIRVRGSWELCVDPNFRGKCTIINGSEDRLSYIRMNDNITSLRPVRGRRAQNAGYNNGHQNNGQRGQRDQRRGGITLFKDPGFRGGAVSFNGPVYNLAREGFNDTASSIDVRNGAWLVCSDPDFRGRCEIIDGDVDYLKYIRMNDNISSLRPANGRRGRH